MSLRAVDEDISGVQGAPRSDTVVPQDHSKLALIRQSIDSLKEKAPELDLLLQGARLTLTRDGVPASCLDMVSALLRRLGEADRGLAGQQQAQQQAVKKDTQSKSLGLRKRTLLTELRKLQDIIEMQGLKEPTMPAVQHRLRALSDLEGQLKAQHTELQNIRDLQEKQDGGEDLLEELETQWKEIQKGFSDRTEQCTVLLELLKKFQSCRGHLSNTIQRAEQAIRDRASYMGKDNLQRSIANVYDIKEELGGLRERMDEMRAVCRQLQSELKKFPECSESPYEAEADTLMDNWLDVTEKTDAYVDNLRVVLERWEKQLMLGEEVNDWARAKLSLFAKSHPFHNEQQVLAMKDEIHTIEENIEHFHQKSAEIQEMLESQDPPLELQVVETQLRKKIGQVKELFTDCTDVFEELMVVKKHLAQKIAECQFAVENIQSSVSKIDASGPKVEAQIQELCDDLETQENQAEDVMKEVGLVSHVASPQVLEPLAADYSKLTDAISRTKDMIHLKREERDKGLLRIVQDERQTFEEWFQDVQLFANECFENPESRADVETSLQRLTGFLKSKDAERRLEQLKDQLERGSQEIPSQQLSELANWLKEQQVELETFTAHCHNRQKQMESLLSDLNCLQKENDRFSEWLQTKEKQSLMSGRARLLLKDLQDQERAETLSELLASVRRRGVRGESLLEDGDNLIQRYRNLKATLQKQVEAQNTLQEEFNAQAESTRTWIADLLQPLTSPVTQTEGMKHKAQAILSLKTEGDSKLNKLRRQSQSMCEQEDLEESRKQDVQQSVRETEKQWTTALQTAEMALNQAETQALLDEDLHTFKTQSENVQSWIRDQELNLQSGGGTMQAEEKLQIIQATLTSKPEGESKLQELKRRCQCMCDNLDLDESRRRDIQDTVRQTEEQWRKVLQAAEEALNKAETEATTERDLDAFKTQRESIQSWIKEQKEKLLALRSHVQFAERLQIAQAVLSSAPDGQSKLLDLKRQGESLCEHLDESRKPEVQQLVKNTEQQWRSVLQTARLAEHRSLADDFDTQSKSTQSWIRDRQQKLQSVGSQTPPGERCIIAQAILSSRPEGDCKVNNLRRRGQSLCDHPDAEEGRTVQVRQTVRDTEEQWKTLLQAAQKVEVAAEAQIGQETERRKLELREFHTHQQDTGRWLVDLQQRLDSLGNQTKAEDRLQAAQDILSSKSEGDSKLQELRRRGQSLCGQDLEECKKQEVQQKIKGTEEQWTGVMLDAKQAWDQAKRQCALEGQLRDYEVLKENTKTWLEEKQQSLVSLDRQADPEKTVNTAQTVLSCKPVGDSKLTELRRLSQSLSDQEDLEEDTKREAQQMVKDSEEQWKTVLQTAENTLKKAEVQYSLSRELEAFCAQAGSTKSWVKELQEQADSKGKGTQGSQAQLEDRLKTAQAILSTKSNGEARVMELRRRAQSLGNKKDLEMDKKLEVKQKVKDTEQQWRMLLQAAEETQRQLKGIVERLVSCQHERGQAEAQLFELQKQTSSLPRVFPWPGLGERRQAVEQARSLLDQSTALAPVLTDLQVQAAELFEITQDPGWSEPSWAAKEESIPALLKELTDALANLEQGILTERQCTQLMEQHEAAQDWLRDHVKGLGAPPADRQGLHTTANTLKALLQTVDREQREMKELDSARDNLMNLCTPAGQDALALAVSHLHDLCSTSEQEVRQHLMSCEAQLEELDSQLARRTQRLKEGAAALQWELRSLDQALSYSEPQNNIAQLQQHWHSLQNCERSLEDLCVKVHDLHQEVKSTPATNELPAEIISVVESLCQQHDSLKSRLNEHQGNCSTNTARCLMDCLHALQQWNKTEPSESISSVQVTLEDGEKLQVSLREALSHQHFLKRCLTPDLFEKLDKEGSETLSEADTRKASLSQSLKELEKRSKDKQADIQSSDVLCGSLEETKASLVAPPRKSKHPPEKEHQLKLQQNIPSTEKSVSVEDKLTVPAEAMQTEAETLKLTMTSAVQDAKSSCVKQTRTETIKRKSQSPTCDSEHITSQEAQFKCIKLDTTTELVTAEHIKPTVEETILIQKANKKSTPVIRDDTAPVPSRRKSKASDADKEHAQVEPEVVETTATQRSPRNQTESASVRESKQVTTGILDVSEPFTIVPVTAAAAGEVTTLVHETLKTSVTQSVSEQPKTTVKLGPTKETKTPEVSLNISDAKPVHISDSSEHLLSLVTSEPITETDAEQPKSIPKRHESKGSKVSTTSEPAPNQGTTTERYAECEEIQNEPIDTATEPTDIPSEPTDTAVMKESKLLPTKKKSKSQNISPQLSNKKDTQTMGKPDSQILSRDQTDAAVVEQRKRVPIRKKSKSFDVSSVTGPVSPLDRITDVKSTETKQEQSINVESKEAKKEDERGKVTSTVQAAMGATETVIMEEGKLPPITRKSESPTVSPQLSHEEENLAMVKPGSHITDTSTVEETKLISTRRKSETQDFSTVAEPLSPLERVIAVEPKETIQEPEKYETKATALRETKLAPTWRKSKSFDVSTALESVSVIDETISADSKEAGKEPKSVKASTEPTTVEEGKLIPTSRKSTSFDVSTSLESVSIIDETIKVESKEAGKEPESGKVTSTAQATVGATETIIMEEGNLHPTTRKSGSPKVSPQLSHEEETLAMERPGSHITDTSTVEETKLISTRRISETQDFSTVAEPLSPLDRVIAVEPKETIQEPEKYETKATALRETKLAPTWRKSKSFDVSTALESVSVIDETINVDSKEAGKKSKSPKASTDHTTMEEGKLIPTWRKSKSLDFFTALESLSIIDETIKVESKEAGKELESPKATSTTHTVLGASETIMAKEDKLLSTTRKSESPKVSPQLSHEEETPAMEEPASQMTDAALVEETKFIPSRKKSESTEVSTVAEPVSPLERHTGVDIKELKQEPEKHTKTAECIKRQHETADQYKRIVSEETKLALIRRRSKSCDLDKASEAIVTHVRSPDVEPEQNKKELEGHETSTPDAITVPTVITVVEEGKLSPTKRKSKGQKPSSESPSKGLTKTREEPDSQKPSLAPEVVTQITVLEEGKLSLTKIRSDGLKPSPEPASTKLIKANEELHDQHITAPTEITVVEKDKPSVPRRKLKGHKPFPEPTSTELIKTKETDGQKPFSTLVVVSTPEGKLSPTKLMSEGLEPSPAPDSMELMKTKEEPDSQKPSSASKVLTEMTILEEGKLSPTKIKSEGHKPCAEPATTELVKTEEEPDGQKPSSTPDVVTEPAEIAAVGKEKFSEHKRKSKGHKPSRKPATTELVKREEQPDGQKPPSTPEVVTAPSEITVAEKGALSTPIRKSKDLKPFPEPATTELVKTKEEPVGQKPPSTPEVVTAPSEITVAEKGALSTPIRKSKDLKPFPEPATTELVKTKEEPVGQKPPSTPEVVTAPSEITVAEKGALSTPIRKSKDLKPFPEPATTELVKTKEEPVGQKPPSTPEVVTAPSEITVAEKGALSTPIRKSKDLKPFPEPATTELVKTKEEPVGQKPPSTPEVVTAPSEITVAEKGALSTPIRKSKDLKPFPEPATTELVKTKEEPVGQKPPSTPEVVTAPSEITVAEKGALSTPIRKSKDLKPFPEPATTELVKTKEEPVGQKPPSTPEVVTAPSEITVAEKGALSTPIRKSKDLKPFPEPATTELVKTKEEPVGQKPPSTPEVVTAPSEITVAEKGALSTPIRKSKDLKPFPEPATTELVKTKEEPVGQKPPSTPEVVTAPSEITVAEKGALSTPIRKSKDLKPFPEPATTELVKTKEEPVGQKPPSTPEVVTAPSEITVAEKGALSTPIRKSKDLKPFPEPATTELVKTKEEPVGQKPPSTPEVVTAPSEITVAEKGALSTPIRKSKDLKPFPEPATTELVKTKEEPVGQKPPSTPDVLTEPAEIAAVGKEKHSEHKRKSKGHKPASTELKIKEEAEVQKIPFIDVVKSTVSQQGTAEESQTTAEEISTVCEKSIVQIGRTDVIPTFPGRKVATIILETFGAFVQISDTQPHQVDTSTSSPHTEPLESVIPPISTPSEPTVSELQELKDRSKKAPEQTITQSTKTELGTGSQMQPPLASEPTDGIDLIDNLCKGTPETQKRYLVLDLPDKGVTKSCEMKPVQTEAGTVAESDSTQPASAVSAMVRPERAETELTEIISSEPEIFKLSKSLNQLELMETTEERLKDDREHSVQKECVQVSTQDSPESLDKKFVEMDDSKQGAEQNVLQISTKSVIQKREVITASIEDELELGMDQSSILCEMAPESKDTTTTDVQPVGVAVELQGSVAKSDSIQLSNAAVVAALVPLHEAETSFSEISEQEAIKPTQAVIQLELLKPTEEGPKWAKDYDLQGEQTVSTHDMQDSPESPGETSVKKVHKEPEEHIIQADIPTSPEQHEDTSVTAAEEPKIGVTQTSIQREREPDSQDETTADVRPDKAVAEMSTTEVQERRTEIPDSVAQRDSAQPTSDASEASLPHEAGTELTKVSSSEQAIEKPSQTESPIAPIKTTHDRPKVIKKHYFQEQVSAMSTDGMDSAPKSLDKKSVKKDKIRKKPKKHIIQAYVPISPEQHEDTSVTAAEEPKIGVTQTSIQREREPDSQDETTADVRPDKAIAEMSTTEVQERRTEIPDSVAQRDSAQPTSDASNALHPCETELIETAFSEQVIGKPGQTKTETGFLKTTLERATEDKEHGVQKEHPVTTTKEIKIDVVQTQSEREPENKDKTVAVAATRTELQQISTEIQEDVKHSESTQPTSVAEQPSKTVIELGFLKTTVKTPEEIKDHKVEEEHAEVSTKDFKDAPQSLDDKSVEVENICQGDDMLILEPSTEVTVKEHEITCFSAAGAPGFDVDQTSILWKTDLTSASERPEKAALEMTMVEVKLDQHGHQEQQDKLSAHEMDDQAKVLNEKFITVEKIPKEANVHTLDVSVLIAKEPATEISQTSMEYEKMPESKDKTTTDHEKAAVKIKDETQQVQSGSQEDVPQSDSAQPVSAVCAAVQPSESKTESVRVTPSQRDTQFELFKTTLERLEEVKDPSVQEEQANMLTHEMHGVPGSQDAKPVERKELDLSVQEEKGVTTEKELSMESTIELETVKVSEDMTATDGQPDKATVKMARVEVQETRAESLSGLSVAAIADMDRHKTDATEKKEEPKEEKKREMTARVELRKPPMTATTGEEKPQGFDLPQEQGYSADKTASASQQAYQKSSADVILGEVIQVGGLPTRETKVEAGVMKTETIALEPPEGSALFTDIQLVAGTGPSSQLTEGDLLEDATEALLTVTSDLDGHLSRLVSQILRCKNRPAELSPTAMGRQVEEAQQCRKTAQAQVAQLSQLRGAGAENRDALGRMEDQWHSAARDAATVIQSKEAQMQLVTDYCRQIQTAKDTVERLTMKMSPEHSSSKEAEQLCSLQKSMEENGTILGELLMTSTQLSPHLSWSERAATQAEQKNLHEKWRGLERLVERLLHSASVHSHETSSLLSQILALQEHLDTVGKELEAKSPSVTPWDCKKAQQLMTANAEVKAARQKYLHLQQLSKVLLLSPWWEKETQEIKKGLQMVKDKLKHAEELVSSQTQNCSNPIMEKIIVVMRDGLAWAKQTESDIEGRRKRVALLPEDVHRKLKDLKTLQSEVMAKQGQLETLVEEVTELLPQLDQAEEVPMVRSTLESLEQLSKSTTEKLAKAVRETESGLQTREKLSEQIADVDSWVVAHLHREVSRTADGELRSPAELDRRARQIQETLAEAEKQAAVCEALLMKSKDISSELSSTENCQLFEKLTNLQEDVRAISSYEKANKTELDDLIQAVDSSKKHLVTIEKSLRQMLVDVSRHRFPITRESLQALEPFKHMILEHKSQVDLLHLWIPQEKARELHSVISELYSKIVVLEMKATDHEKYLNMRQHVEDLKENIQEQVRQTKEESMELEEKYKVCQSLLVQFPLIKLLCKEARAKLQTISADLYPSQLNTEQQRLKQIEESLDTWEMKHYNNLSIIEWNLLKELDLESEKKASEAFLSETQQELQRLTVLEPHEAAINKKYQRIMSLKKTVEARMRALEFLEQNKGKRKGSESRDVTSLKNAVLSECDSQMENISQARESLRAYMCAVRQAVQFLRDIEASLLPPYGSVGLCSERVEEAQQALAALQEKFQTHVEELQSQVALHPYLSPQKVEQLQENILSQLLVRMSTLQAKGHVRLDCLRRCAEHLRNYIKCQDEIFQSVKSVENSLLELISQKVTCLADCTEQLAKLKALSEEWESPLRRLQELKEWCPEHSCCGGRELALTAVWKRLSRLRHCTQELTARSKQRISEWSNVTNGMEKACTVLEQVEAELPDASRVMASTEELHDLLQSWEQYQDRLDCEHRSLSALELRAARLLGVPAHLEQAPPTPLCQQLQGMQARYSSVIKRSSEGLKAAKLELEEREKVQEQLHGVQAWLEATDGLLSEMEQSSSTQELQEVHSQLYTQNTLLQHIMERVKVKYTGSPVPVEIDGHLQEVAQSLKQMEVKVGEAVEMSGPVHRLGANLSEIQAGLRAVQKRLDQRSPTVIEAKITQKIKLLSTWNELDVWHPCLAALEVKMHDLEKPEETLILTERLMEVQQFHSQLAKQAEQRTTLLGKITTWLQEHQEMITSSKSWIADAQSWLTSPCSYITAKCLSNRVHALQAVLNDSAQIQTTLQGFSSVLQEMSQVCDVTALQDQLVEADREVASVQDSFTAPLSQLEHAATEVEAIESKVRKMENDVAEIKTILSSPETFPSPREESLKAVEKRILSMRQTVAEIQKCKPGLCLPEKAEETLTVFTVVDLLQSQLLELEKKVPALFIQQPLTPTQAKAPSAQDTTSQPQLLKPTSEEDEKGDTEQGKIRIVHVEEDVLKRSGAKLLTVEQASPEQRQLWTPDSTQQREHEGVLQAEEAREKKGSEEQTVEESGGGVWWWLWDVFLGIYPQGPVAVVPGEIEAEHSSEQAGDDGQDVEGPTDTTEASSPEGLSKPLGTVTTQSLPESMELAKGRMGLAWRGADSKPEGLKTYTSVAVTGALPPLQEVVSATGGWNSEGKKEDRDTQAGERDWTWQCEK
uniref:uncharacterized protein LOC109966618 n=1 Tax=Monopterus albus TaxID=43700 RepID=UPI0009B46CDD|nr:uncharacterized protein LOC109966618 [Monopterus albus]